jgi:hypothetical protein
VTGGLVTEDASIGKLVEVTVDISESGDHGEYNSFTGRIRGTILDRVHVEYHIIETADKGCFLVGPRVLGESLDWAFRTKEEDFWVGIARILDNSILSKREFDLSQVKYYAIGTLRFL